MVGRVAVVGAGPAGIRCAETLVAAGLRPVLIDEGRREGGQIYRRQPDNFTRSYETLYGTEAARAAAVHRSFEAIRERIDYRPETLVWNVSDETIHAVSGATQLALPFDALVICSGATDRLMPVKGWHLAGTYSLGGAQVALKSQACSIGRRVVFMGTGPLLYLVAAQYLKAGATPAAVLDTSRVASRVTALPKLMAQPTTLWKGIALTLALRSGGVPLFTGIEPVEVRGTGQDGVQGVSFKDARGVTRTIDCDAVAMGYHLQPETQLADLARCAFQFDALTRLWLPRVDVDGRSSVKGIYLAGDGARVLGANAAELSGRLAALALLQDRGHSSDEKAVPELRQALAKLQRFAQGLSEAFPWPAGQVALSDDTLACRCESIAVGELRSAVREKDACEANRAKAFSRVGMGRCQGRYCGHAAAEIIARTANIPVEQVGRLRGQAPVKPLPVAVEESA